MITVSIGAKQDGKEYLSQCISEAVLLAGDGIVV